MSPSHLISRRTFLKATSGVFLASSFVSGLSRGVLAVSHPQPTVKTVSLYNIHTGETLKSTFWEKGQMIREELALINKLLRDHRTDDVHPIDLSLLEHLYQVQSTLQPGQAVHIVSAYRSPHSNRALRKRSRGVADKSFHLQGKAVDFFLPKISLKKLHQFVLTMKAGGVGYYPKTNFIHMDVGPLRHW